MKAISIWFLLSASIIVQQDLHQAMTNMMEKMKSMKMTGNADHDFAMMMAEHHQGSIDMSEIIVRSGKDDKIKKIAEKILDKQTKEQQDLRSHRKPADQDHEHAARSNQNADVDHKGFSKQMTEAMNEMESHMQNMKMTNNPDHDFATMMIPHHEAAIDMSDAILQHGKDQEIKAMAEKIKSDSKKEITELKDWLNSHGK